MNFTRRDFSKFALAAIPASQAFAAINSKINGVQIGAITYSFNTLANDPPSIIQAYVDVGLGEPPQLALGSLATDEIWICPRRRNLCRGHHHACHLSPLASSCIPLITDHGPRGDGCG